MSPPSEAATADAMPIADTKPAYEDGPLMDHAYDGIREYDNPLPGWWRMIFWATIVFAAGYWVWFHVAHKGATPDDKYRAALADYNSKRDVREAAEAANVTEPTLAKDAADGALVAHGQAIFTAKCASCHGADGRGLIGPNLTDDFQIHGSTRMDIYKTVRGGVPGTAMPAWGEQLPAPDVVAAASYAISLRNTHVANGKAPQGLRVEPFR